MGMVREVNGMFELTEDLPRSQFYNISSMAILLPSYSMMQ